jgi:hypothetical protein
MYAQSQQPNTPMPYPAARENPENAAASASERSGEEAAGIVKVS